MQRFPKILSAFAIASLSAIALASRPAMADTFNLTYSGAQYGNSALITGTIDLDLSKVNNPGYTDLYDTPFVTGLNLTVSGASSGNGTFDLTDYDLADGGDIDFDTGGATLDFTQSLFGQLTPNGPWETWGGFDLFVSSKGITDGAPYSGASIFGLGTNDGNGDFTHLTSFSPAVTATPEPSTNAALGLGVVGISGLLIASRKRRKPVA